MGLKERSIFDAVNDGDVAELKALIAGGADLNARNSLGWTPLHLAAAERREMMVPILVAAGSNIDAQNRLGWTPLHAVAAAGHDAIIRVLVASGARVDRKDSLSRTPLYYAVNGGHVSTAKTLLDVGADVSALDARDGAPVSRWLEVRGLGKARMSSARNVAKSVTKRWPQESSSFVIDTDMASPKGAIER